MVEQNMIKVKTASSNKSKNTGKDLVKIIATSGVLAFLGLTRSCTEIPKEMGIPIEDPSGLVLATMAFDVGAGAFAGFRDKYKASLAVYGATLLPDVYNVLTTGDLVEAGKMVLAKTIVYGASYALGYIFR